MSATIMERRAAKATSRIGAFQSFRFLDKIELPMTRPSQLAPIVTKRTKTLGTSASDSEIALKQYLKIK